MSTMPPLPALHAFALVVEAGSIAAAARRLGVTQPAVSAQVRALEASLGVALLRRGANAAVPTEAGARYAASLSAAIATMQAATAALRARQAPPLRLRAYTTFALRWLIPRLGRFHAQHPTIRVEISTGLEVVNFARHAVDAAILTAPRAPARNAMRLMRVTLMPFAVPRLARRWQAVHGELLGSVVRPGDWGLWCEARGQPDPAPLLYESTSLAIQAALEGLGAVIAPPEFLAGELRSRRLVALDEAPLPTPDSHWLLLPPGRVAPATEAFRAWLAEEMQSARGG
jgi:LysR family glycine cleavage system transcriptional activator